MKKEIKISEVLSLLENGYTRYEKDAEVTGKSIQAYYGLPASKIATIFQHDKLKFQKTDFNSFELIDDTEQEITAKVDSDVVEALSSIAE